MNPNLREIAQNIDKQVWSHIAFPSAHRPQLNELDQISFVSQIPFRAESFHPQMRPQWLAQGKQAIERDRILHTTKVGMYYPDTREIFLSEELLRYPLRVAQRVLSHELATDTLERASHINPQDYNSQQSAHVSQSLEITFDLRNRPSIDDTRIRKTGFRESVEVDGYYVADLLPPAHEVAKVYPTVFEIITDQALQHRVTNLDSRLRLGTATLSSEEDHPIFAAALWSIIPQYNWKRILDSFHASSPGEIITNLEATTKTRQSAKQIFSKLVNSMAIDENNIRYHKD